MKKKVISAGIIILIGIAIILLILLINNYNDKRDIECFNDDGCPPQVWDYFCNEGGYACNFTVYYRCLNVGTEDSRCVPRNCSVACLDCQGDCEDGFCVDKPDLIVVNITNRTYPGAENMSFFVVVKNVGLLPSDANKLRLIIDDGPVYILDVPELAPNELEFLEQVYFLAAHGSRYILKAKVDFLDWIDESNEINNEFTFVFDY